MPPTFSTIYTTEQTIQKTNNMFNLPPRIPPGFDRDEHLKGIKKLMSLLELMKPEQGTSEIVEYGNFGVNLQSKIKNDMIKDDVVVMNKNKLSEEISKIEPKLKKQGQIKLSDNGHVFTKHQNIEETTSTPFVESTTPYLQSTAPALETTTTTEQTTTTVTQPTTQTTTQTTTPVIQTTIPYVERINPFIRKNIEVKEVDNNSPYSRPNIQVLLKFCRKFFW